jgi:hypothetical protein
VCGVPGDKVPLLRQVSLGISGWPAPSPRTTW